MIKVPIVDLEVNAPEGCRVTVTVLRSNSSRTLEGSGVFRAVPLGLVRVEYGGKKWEEVYDFTEGSVSVYENLSVEYSPLSLALLALSVLPTAACIAAVKVKEARENSIPKPGEFRVEEEKTAEKEEEIAEDKREVFGEAPRPEESENREDVEEPGKGILEEFDYSDFTLRDILERVRE